MEIDEFVVTAPAHAELKEEAAEDEEESLFGGDAAAARARALLRADQKPEAPPCQCFPCGQGGLQCSQLLYFIAKNGKPGIFFKRCLFPALFPIILAKIDWHIFL